MSNFKKPLTHHMDMPDVPLPERLSARRKRLGIEYESRIKQPTVVQDCHEDVCRMFSKYGVNNSEISVAQGKAMLVRDARVAAKVAASPECQQALRKPKLIAKGVPVDACSSREELLARMK